MMTIENWPRAVLLTLSLLLSLTYTLTAQDKPTSLFRSHTAKSVLPQLDAEISSYALLELDPEDYALRYAEAAGEQTLTLPATSQSPALELHLRPNRVLTENFILRRASDGRAVPVLHLGHHYVGEVAGRPGSKVVLSMTEAALTARIVLEDGRRLALAPALETATEDLPLYALYPEAETANNRELDCATPDGGLTYSKEDLRAAENDKSTGGCVDVYLEVDYDIFAARGRNARTVAEWVAAQMNEVSLLYQNIRVNLRVSEILVWDRTSPYSGAQSTTLLRQFQSERRSFNGDLAQLLSFQASGGVAVVDGLCFPSTSGRMSFSSLGSDYRSVPTFSWNIMVIAHELGHLMGSQHTHACVWNGNDTALDACPGFTEGGCNASAPPAGGGSIMSYCHLGPVGISFDYGFGPQPGNLIANRVAAAQNCVQANCGTPPPPPPPPGDNGGGSGDGDAGDDETEAFSCDEEAVYLRLVLDDFGMETTWEIRTEAGQRVASGGPYPKKQAGRTVRDSICLPQDCYTFTVFDEDKDGICCDHGGGSYTLTDADGNTLATGAEFDSLEVTDFCLPDLPPQDNDNCIEVNFVDNPVVSFGTNQDRGRATVSEGGRTLRLDGNAWKAVEYGYEITPNTRLSFWFRSTREGEIQGIGFDDNEIISSAFTFRLYGIQNWGLSNYNDYPGDGQWRYYSIPVGQFYTGLSKYIFFASDHDGGRQDAVSEFRDLALSEGEACSQTVGELRQTEQMLDQLELFPNPATDHLRVNGLESGDTYRVLDASGRELLQGGAAGEGVTINSAGLASGTYVLRVEGARGVRTGRFTVVR